MTRRLWNFFDGEPFLDNPYLYVNPRRRSRRTAKVRVKKMATRRKRNLKGQFVKRGGSTARRTVHRRRRAAPRRHAMRTVRVVKHPALVNPRRRTYRSNPVRRHRRSYRRNPIAFGSIFSMHVLTLAAYTGAGFLGTPLVAGFVMGYVPITDATTRKWVGYGVDVGAAWGLSWAADKTLGKDASRAVLAGGLAYVAVSLVREFTTPSLSAYRRMGSQPLLGNYRQSGMGSIVTTRTADRLNPAGRF